MNILRISKNPDNPYVMVDKHFVEDKNLSAKAKGILLYLLSKPDNWQVYQEDITKNMKEGKEAIRSGINELIESNYIERTRLKDDKGKFSGYEYIVRERPVTQFSVNGKPAPTNNEYTNICTSEKEKNPNQKQHNDILETWNSVTIIHHTKLTTKMQKEMDKLLNGKRQDIEEKKTVEQIKKAIINYGQIVNSNKYYFNYRWKLDEFLRRGFNKFDEDWIIISKNFEFNKEEGNEATTSSLKEQARERTRQMLEEETNELDPPKSNEPGM